MQSVLFLLLQTASFVVPVSAHNSCNPELYAKEFQDEDYTAPLGSAGSIGPLVLLPQDKGDESPASLDGSPYGFYFVRSKTGSTKWTIQLQGGGWCYDEVDCYLRSKGKRGTSKVLPKYSGCPCMNPEEDGSFDDSCNCIFMNYLDGASFSGYRAKPWPVPEDNATCVPKGATVTFRGIKNLDGMIDFAMKHGMTNATEMVVAGESAGGLAAFLHADRIAGRLKAQSPKINTIRAAPVVGYFLDHDNFKHTTSGMPNAPGWVANYTTYMKYVYFMQNLTFGADGGLMEACRAKHPEEPWLCFMSPHMQDVIKTPFFMFNSKYDAWQLGNEFQSKWTTKEEQEGVLQYGKDFMTQLAPVYADGEAKNGGMITSCICHGCPWTELKLEGKSSFQHFADWFYGKTSGNASMHIDTRSPNGDGTLSGGSFKLCAAFPNQSNDFVPSVV